MVNNSSSCCSDSLHSRSASDRYSSSSASEFVEDEGRESISSAEDGSTKLSLLIDMAIWGLKTGKGSYSVCGSSVTGDRDNTKEMSKRDALADSVGAFGEVTLRPMSGGGA